jgi:hypothetical protein
MTEKILEEVGNEKQPIPGRTDELCGRECPYLDYNTGRCSRYEVELNSVCVPPGDQHYFRLEKCRSFK